MRWSAEQKFLKQFNTCKDRTEQEETAVSNFKTGALNHSATLPDQSSQ
jgi:hypothetical protein